MKNKIRLKITIKGIVQGVGFRPTVYLYATENALAGYVNNTVSGVFIEVEGSEENVYAFVSKLKEHPPKEAHIDSFEWVEVPLLDETTFHIIKSESSDASQKDVEISPDLSTCSECLQELRDKSNRRYGYPFINCTNCGPRFTIVEDRPYDRPLTSMKHFPMCEACQKEYDSPLDRRFHAQPNACEKCGPKLHLIPLQEQEGVTSSAQMIALTQERLKQGQIVAIKGLGGFNVACNPWDQKAVLRLREIKKRPTKSFALMAKNIEMAKQFVWISPEEEKVLCSSAAPIVLLEKRKDFFEEDYPLEYISPDNNELGIMLPSTPLHHLLMEAFDLLIMTSANWREEPIAARDEELDFSMIDMALSHNRPIRHRADDSIVQVIDGELHLIRRSRGFVPRSLLLKTPNELEATLSGEALGSFMKNCFALRKKNRVYLSQHIGEMEEFLAVQYQKREREEWKKLLEITPFSVIGDAHPGFFEGESTQTLFHHHAHALSVMAEHHLLGKEVLAFIADGTGFGSDGTLWGWECLRIGNNYREFERKATLKAFPLMGGVKAIYDIERIALALAPMRKTLSEKEKQLLALRDKGINSPLTSSLGRLFDGVSSLLGLIHQVDYEAQGAILLQREAVWAFKKLGGQAPRYRFKVSLLEGREIDYGPLVEGLFCELEEGRELSREKRGELALAFHYWVIEAMMAVLDQHYDNSLALVFSGGCFQNRLLYKLLKEALSKRGWSFYINRQVPCNDGGLALGQMVFQGKE